MRNKRNPLTPDPSPAVPPNPAPAPATVPNNSHAHPASILHLPQPDPWPEPVDGQALLTDIAGRLSKYVSLPRWAAETLALWVLHTYAFELRDVSTYIGIESPEKRCGKTTLLRLLSQMVSRPVIAANISPPALFRVIQEAHPTLLIDEADTFLEGNDELRGILNSGYERATAYVVRVRQGGHTRRSRRHPVPVNEHLKTFMQLHPSVPAPLPALALDPSDSGSSFPSQLERFSCWCPKAMAAIGKLGETLSDRCITIRMQRKTSTETCAKLRDYADNGLRSRCVRFVADNAHAISAARPDMPDLLNDRAADIWEPLIVLADLAAGAWPVQTRAAAIASAELRNENAPISTLLADLFIVFITNGKRIFTRDIVTHLEEFGDRPYRSLCAGRPLTPLCLSQLLRPYGIEPRTVWIDGVTAKGYCAEDFQDVFKRYLAKEEVKEYLEQTRIAWMEALQSQPNPGT